MEIYLDVSCLNRPFDDQSQARIRLESTAVVLILERFDTGDWQQVSSEMAVFEIDAIPDFDRFQKVGMLLPDSQAIMAWDQPTFQRAAKLCDLGFKPADAVHIASAEQLKCDAFLSCNDRLCRLAEKCRNNIRVTIRNPIDWLKEVENADA